MACPYTNPTNDNSKFTIAIVPVVAEQPTSDIRQPKMMAVGRRLSNVAGSTNFALKWQSAQGRIYSVYATPNLSEGWPETPTAEILGTGDVLEYVPEQTDAVQFFKVSVRLIED